MRDGGRADSLNEAGNSEFAKAVDATASRNMVSKYIPVGTTPKVLKILGVPNLRVTISGEVLNKVMHKKHRITADALKRLPQQINDPVAIMNSATRKDAYVVLTELVEQEKGKDKPVIAALHLKKSKQGLELISIASVYGRNNSQIQRSLDNDVMYWNTKKGSQFVTAFGLQLPSHMQSNENLLKANIKTENDLTQDKSSDDNILHQSAQTPCGQYHPDSKTISLLENVGSSCSKPHV